LNWPIRLPAGLRVYRLVSRVRVPLSGDGGENGERLEPLLSVSVSVKRRYPGPGWFGFTACLCGAVGTASPDSNAERRVMSSRKSQVVVCALEPLRRF